MENQMYDKIIDEEIEVRLSGDGRVWINHPEQGCLVRIKAKAINLVDLSRGSDDSTVL